MLRFGVVKGVGYCLRRFTKDTKAMVGIFVTVFLTFLFLFLLSLFATESLPRVNNVGDYFKQVEALYEEYAGRYAKFGEESDLHLFSYYGTIKDKFVLPNAYYVFGEVGMANELGLLSLIRTMQYFICPFLCSFPFLYFAYLLFFSSGAKGSWKTANASGISYASFIGGKLLFYFLLAMATHGIVSLAVLLTSGPNLVLFFSDGRWALVAANRFWVRFFLLGLCTSICLASFILVFGSLVHRPLHYGVFGFALALALLLGSLLYADLIFPMQNEVAKGLSWVISFGGFLEGEPSAIKITVWIMEVVGVIALGAACVYLSGREIGLKRK